MKSQLRFVGVGGQGVILAGEILSAAKIKAGGYGVKASTYTSQVRGGPTKVDIILDEKEILYPYLKKNKYPDLTMEQFIKEFDLRNSQEFIEKNNKNIIFMTSKDDILITESDLDYINKTFGNKVIIPYGGHTGILWHKDVANLMIDKLEEE